MKSIGGFGGVRLSVTVGVNTYTVEFDKHKGYCSQAQRKPVINAIVSGEGETNQVLRGYKFGFEAKFENVTAGDEDKLKALMGIVMKSQMNGVPIRLWPKWNLDNPDPEYYDVIVTDKWGLSDISKKAKVGERINVTFETQELAAIIPCHLPGRYIPVYATMDGEVIIFGDSAIEILRSWRP